jgi:hypothetical protein
MKDFTQTQQGRILAYLRGRGWVSAWAIMHECRVICFTKRVSEARRAGHNIELRWIEPTDGPRYSEYRLVEA